MGGPGYACKILCRAHLIFCREKKKKSTSVYFTSALPGLPFSRMPLAKPARAQARSWTQPLGAETLVSSWAAVGPAVWVRVHQQAIASSTGISQLGKPAPALCFHVFLMLFENVCVLMSLALFLAKQTLWTQLKTNSFSPVASSDM